MGVAQEAVIKSPTATVQVYAAMVWLMKANFVTETAQLSVMTGMLAQQIH